MTGDATRREKALSLFLSTLMMLSVVAIAGVGFTGSAVAQEFNGDIDDASVVAANATADNDPTSNNADHIFRIDVGDGDVDADLDNVTIKYSEDVDLSEVDATDTLGTNNDISVFVDGTESGADTSTGGNGITVDNGANNIVIDGLSNDAQNPNDATVTVVVGDVGNPSQTDSNVTAIVKDNDVDSASVTDLELAIGSDAPIEVTDENGDALGQFGLLEVTGQATGEAANDKLDTGHTVDISGVVDNNDPTNNLVGGNILLDISTDDVTIEGTNNAEVLYGTNTGVAVNVQGDVDGTTVSGVKFDAAGDGVTTIDATAGDGPINLTVSNNELVNVDATAVDAELHTGGNPATHVIDDNTIDSTSSDAIVVDAADLGSDDSASVSDNPITATGTSGIDITGLGDDVLTLSGNDIEGDSSAEGIIIGTVSDNVTVSGGTVDDVNNGVDITSSGGTDGVTVSDTVFTNVTGSAVNAGTASSNGDIVTVDGIEVDDSATGTGISVSDRFNVEVIGSTSINDTKRGIDLGSAEATATISGASITNTDSSNEAIRIDDPDGNTDTAIVVNASTSIDQAGTGIDIDLTADADATVDIDGVEINGTSSGVNLADLSDATDQAVNVTDSTFTNNDGAGLNYSETDTAIADTRLNVHFNTFEDNDVGIGIDDGGNNFNGVFNATFNDFVSNDNAGLDVVEVNTGTGVVNANYSYWGSTTGPNATSNVKALNAFGNGDDVSVNNAGDANVFPFLKESIDELSSSQRSGDQLVLIENPNHTQEVERGDMFVTVLDQNSGLTANQIVAEDVNGNFETLENPDGSGELGLTNAATIEHRALNSGEFDVSVRATGFGDDTTAQTITGELDSTAISANTTEIGAGETVELTVTALDEDDENVLRQGVGDVIFTETNAGGAGVNLVDNEVSVANDGELTVLVEPSGIDSGGGDFQLDAQLGSTSPVSLNITPVAGDIDAGESTVELAGETFTEDKNGTVNETQEFSVEVQDSSSNNISGVDVTFDANASVFDGSETVTETTGDNGNVTAEFTLPTEAGAVNFNVTADSTTLEDQNVTAEAAAAQELAFDTDGRNVPLDGDANVTVVAEDKFGNANATGDDVTLSSSDSDVLNITDADNQRSLDADGAEFELNGKQPGSVTVTASVSENYSNVSDEFIVDTPAGLDVSLNRSSLSEAQSGAENVSLVEAQLTDSEGNEFGASNVDVDFAVQSPRTVEIVNDEFSDTTDSTGLATTNVTSLTDEFGTSTIEVFATEFGLQETVDITVSGQIDSYAVSVENNTALTTETVNATVQFVDSEDRVVPLNNTSISLATPSDVGSVDSSVTTNISENGVVEGEFQINADEAGSVDVRAIGQGISTITEDVVAFDSVLELNEQATDAPRFNAENDSGPAVVVESVNTDGDEAAVIVTFENGGNDTIAGLETGTFDNENVAVAVEDTGGFPGDHTAHVIPTDELSSDYAAGDNVSTETLNNVTDDATATVFNAALDFEDQSFDGSTDQVTVNTSDLQPNDTDYVIVVHPTADDGSIQSPVGNSGDLTGAQDNVTVDVDQINENNEFVAMLHFTDSEDAFGSAIPNADDEDGFVAGNVADQATITVQEPASFSVSDLSPVDATVDVGEEFDVSATITNDGDLSDTQNIELRLEPDGNAVRNESVQLDGGENQTVTFENVSVGQAGESNHTVASEDDRVSGNLTVESQVAASVTFNDQTVTSGTEEVIIDSADFTRADGSAGEYVVVVHTIDEFGAPVGNVSPAIGASDDLTGAEENITVDLTAANGPINSLTENVTLRAMLHTTANDRAFGTRLGNAIDGIERGDETDDANITVEDEQEATAQTSVTFDDKTVTSGTEEVTVDSANFTRADGSAGEYVVVVHTIDEFGAPVGNVSPAIGASDDLTGAEENITVDLTAADGPINSLTENVTLRAMLHTTANDRAFGTRLGNAIDGIERGDETDDANITVEDPAEFQLSGLDPTEETVQQGDEIDVSVTVTNEGDLEGTQNVTLSIGENEIDEQVTLGAGENTTVSFDNVSTSAIDAPANVTYTVSTDDADVSGNLTVERGLATYQDENGDTSIDQLRDAITDFRNDDIGIDLLRGVIDSFRESQ